MLSRHFSGNPVYDSGWTCPKIQENLKNDINKHLQTDPVLLVGSSLGGYHTARLAERMKHPCVLINPCIDPPNSQKRFLGENVSFEDGHHWVFTEEVLKSYAPLEVPSDNCLSRMVIVGINDELLDHVENARFWVGRAELVLTDDGHSISSFNPAKGKIAKMLEEIGISTGLSDY